MGTRIYPTTRNITITEKLAGVKEGTFNSLTNIILENGKELSKAEADGADYSAIEDIKYKQWELLHDREEGLLDNFLTFGWGKFTTEAFKIIKAHIPSDEDENWLWNGSTKDINLVSVILKAQGVDLEKTGINAEAVEGLSWG